MPRLRGAAKLFPFLFLLPDVFHYVGFVLQVVSDGAIDVGELQGIVIGGDALGAATVFKFLDDGVQQNARIGYLDGAVVNSQRNGERFEFHAFSPWEALRLYTTK